MRKLWLTFTAMLLCSISVLAQLPDATQPDGSGTEASPYLISNASEFVWIANNNYYGVYFKQDAHINFGDLGELTTAIIPTFEGIYDGDGYTITYQAKFNGAEEDGKYGLFGSVDGGRVSEGGGSIFRPNYVYYTAVIKKLNVNANVTLVGSAIDMNVALLCGKLGTRGVIEYCNVSGNINSAVNSENGGGTDAGLVAGQCLGSISYCIASGNVTGIGYVGGIVGQLGDVWNTENPGSITACSFTGAVNADNTVNHETGRQGSFGGGICGMASNNSTIEFCVANADIIALKACNGISSTTVYSQTGSGWREEIINIGTTDVTNSYAGGNINGTPVNGSTITNSARETNLNYYEGQMSAQQIVSALETARINAGHTEFYFDVVNGEVVLIIGQRQTVQAICENPIELKVEQEENQQFIVSWTPVNDNTYYTESTFILTLSGGGELIDEVTLQNVNYFSPGTTLPPSEEPYVFTIKTQCAEGVFSESQQVIFYVDPNCTANVNLKDATTTSATINWQGNVSTVKLGNETYNISEGVTEYTFNNLTPATTYSAEVIFNCVKHEGTTEVTYTKTLTIEFTTLASAFITKQTGDFNDANTWQGNQSPKGKIADIKIGEGHTVYVNHDLVITGSYKITDNQGVLQITQQGQLINNTTTDVPGIIEIVSSPKANQAWTFVGAPFDNYVLGCILPESHDVSVKKYDYTEGGWSDSWAHIGTPMNAGEGYFAFPFLDAPITFTTYGDVGTYEDRGNIGYTSTNTVTDLNISNVEVSLPSNCPNNWMALSNPYPAKLKVSKFLTDNGSKLQGNCVYVFRDGSFDQGNIQTGDIAMTEGFFVNFSANEGDKKITFNKGQLSYNNPNLAKASANEFIKLTLINGDKKVRAYLAHNEDAEQGYDIFDANKLFAPTEIAEPYFVTDGIALMKEEFAELPYYATMNVRSFADDTVSFVVNNIPEGLAVSIIDGENIIDMVEGGVYTTEILTGENADRFKVLIKKSVSISDVEELEVNITNNNRHISIETTETDLQVEVYNALGQKVLSTKDRNFTLNQVSAGAYLIKAFNNKASKTQKIVVE